MNNEPQNLANHAKIDPWFHYVLVPFFSIVFLSDLYALVRHPHHWHSNAGQTLVALALLLLTFRIRIYALRVQDRIIRLEERLRLASLLPESLRPRIGELTVRQLIALRFASDQEIPFLVEKALNEKLDPAAIKKLIQNWRPDYFRI